MSWAQKIEDRTGCKWYQGVCRVKSHRERKKQVESDAEQEKWDALNYIPDDLDEQTMQMVKMMALVGIPVLGLLAWVAKSNKN